MLQENSSLVFSKDNNGNTALHLAAIYDNTDILSILMQHDPQLALQINNDERTALHEVAMRGLAGGAVIIASNCPDAVALLDRRKDTAATLAQTFGHGEIARFLSQPTEDIIKARKSSGFRGRGPNRPESWRK
jgi:ankyrin repeat protein